MAVDEATGLPVFKWQVPVRWVFDLAITKASAPSGAAPGGWLTYTIAVDNLGPSHVVGAQVYDALPAAAFSP